MTVPFTVSWFAMDGDPPVRGALHHVAGSTDGMVLTHGAGSDHGAPLLIAVADAFARANVTVLRGDLPFRQARASGPPRVAEAERDRRGLANALAAIRPFAAHRRFVGGHSYGGRQASMLLATASDLAQGLLLMSYPLHPPGRPDRPRIAHLADIRVPTLFVHGTRDPFGTIDELEAARSTMRVPSRLLTVARAAHGLPAGDTALVESIVSAFHGLVG
jgi:hypothetical protein